MPMVISTETIYYSRYPIMLQDQLTFYLEQLILTSLTQQKL